MNSQQLKIAFLGNQIAWGGGAKSLLLLIKALSDQNFKLYLFVTHCVSDEMKNEFERYVEFVKLVNLPEVTSATTQTIKQNKQKIVADRFDLTNTILFAEELYFLGIDILHINNSVFSPIYKTIRTRTKVKIVTHIREWIDWNGIHQKQEFMINSIKDNSDCIICISATIAKVFEQCPNLFVIPNPFDFQELEFTEMNKDYIKSKLGLEKNNFIIGMMGRSRNKGALDFLKALSYLKKSYKDIINIKFIILGERIQPSPHILLFFLRKLLGKHTYSYELFKYLRKAHLFDEVLFLSNRKDILEIINCFDIAVSPSYSGDSWSRDIIEYMALRKPVVATGASDYLIKNRETGIIVTPRNYIQLAESIYWLYKNKDARFQMGERAYDQIYAKCNMNEFRQNILQVYNTLKQT